MQNKSIASAKKKNPLCFGLTEVTNEPSNCGVKLRTQTGYNRFYTLSMNYCL
jgi:hypothetical protein